MERMLRNVLEASLTTFCAASSQLFGDSESISITFTIFGMSLISFPFRFAPHRGYGRKLARSAIAELLLANDRASHLGVVARGRARTLCHPERKRGISPKLY